MNEGVIIQKGLLWVYTEKYHFSKIIDHFI